MPADYYSDTEAETATAAPPETPAQPPKEETDSAKTEILPKSFFPDAPKPGDMCELEVVRVHDDSVEVRYTNNAGESEPEGGPTESPPNSRMASLMEA